MHMQCNSYYNLIGTYYGMQTILNLYLWYDTHHSSLLQVLVMYPPLRLLDTESVACNESLELPANDKISMSLVWAADFVQTTALQNHILCNAYSAKLSRFKYYQYYAL